MKVETVKCLEAIGYPTTVLVLDFESFFDKDLGFGCQSTIEYVADPRFEFLGCGFQWVYDDYEPEEDPWFIDGPYLGEQFKSLQATYGQDLAQVTVVTDNSKFDITALEYHFGIMPRYTIDVLDLWRFYDARMDHQLKNAHRYFKFLKKKGDTTKFKGLRFAEVKADPEMYKFLVEYTLTDIEDESLLFEHLLPIVDYTVDEAAMARHMLELFIKPRFQVDFKLGNKIAAGMEYQFHKTMKKHDTKVLGSSIKLGTKLGKLLAEHGEKLPLKEKTQKNKKGVIPETKGNLLKVIEEYGEPVPGVGIKICGPAFAKDDDGMKWMLVHSDLVIRELASARLALKSWPTHIKKVKGIMKQARCNKNKMLRVPLHFYGCHTGRPSGAEKINLLNLGGGGRGGAPQHPLIRQVRNMLSAPVGRTLAICDSAQIEARKLAWLAGQSDLLLAFAKGGDPYSDFATDLFGYPVWKWGKDDVEEFAGQQDKVHLARDIGKENILGNGYGKGAKTTYMRCLQNPALRPRFDNGDLTYDFVAKGVSLYRRKFRKIVKFWDRVERAWRIVTQYPGQKIVINVPNSPSDLKFFHGDGSTFIRLPSGRHLRYRNAKVTSSGDLKHAHGYLWGGAITENIDQASSRDLHVFWMLTAQRDPDYDFDVLLFPYDEIAASVPEESAKEHLHRLEEIMCMCPEWATGIPLGCDSCISKTYKKI